MKLSRQSNEIIFCGMCDPYLVLKRILAAGFVTTAAESLIMTLHSRLSGERCPRMGNWTFDKNARDDHLHITTIVPWAPFSCWNAGFQVRQRVVGDKTTDNAEGHCTEGFEFPGRQAPLGPGRDLPWGRKSQMIPSRCAPPFSPRHKRRRWLTPQTALESLTTIFNFKQATHKSWSLLLQTQPLGNHCLADINSLVTVKLPLKNATYFTPCPLTFQSRAWATWSKSRSASALIPKLSISANSMRNLRPEVRTVRGKSKNYLYLTRFSLSFYIALMHDLGCDCYWWLSSC